MSNQPINPLGLPKGSIRAILALVVVIVACQEMLSGSTPSLLLAETLMIVLTHYFTVRRRVQVDTQVKIALEGENVLPVEENPLWLPKGSIRILITLVFTITVIILIMQGRLFDSNVLTTIGPFAAYLLGAIFRRKTPKDQSVAPGWFSRVFAHLLAVFVILIGITLLLLSFNNALPDLVAFLLLSAILYYFGTR